MLKIVVDLYSTESKSKTFTNLQYTITNNTRAGVSSNGVRLCSMLCSVHQEATVDFEGEWRSFQKTSLVKPNHY